MNACGVIVEYNPFHNGHVYHIQQSRKASGADCMIAIMSGSFLQRGEPAFIDKFHRTKAALAGGADIVLELPYAYAVQSSKYFAQGAVLALNEMGIQSLCFGSESGDILQFTSGYEQLQMQQNLYKDTLKQSLQTGESYPTASTQAYQALGMNSQGMDLTKPNNILGFAYVQAILDYGLPIHPLTIQRSKSGYHDSHITHDIASATSIRAEITKHGHVTDETSAALPDTMINMLLNYQHETGIWHTWEHYFPFLHYKVMTMTADELAAIQGVDEGLEHRIKKTAKTAGSFKEWMAAIKTKRYTWTRLQRMFVHILTGTTKERLNPFLNHPDHMPYVRILGMNNQGQAYLNKQKKHMRIPLITRLSDMAHDLLSLEERASNVYYSILAPHSRQALFQQELGSPILSDRHS